MFLHRHPCNLERYGSVGAVRPAGDRPRARLKRDPRDQNGNLTYEGTSTYGYAAESRLTSIKQGSTAVASYAWDAQGRHKSKTVGTTTTMFVTDADNREVLEYDGTSGALQRWYAFGQGPDGVLGQMNVALGTRETMIPDIQGSIVGTLDSGTGTLSKTGYQPFGENPTLTSGTYRWTGRRFDPETAGSAAQPSGLYYFRARTYSPTCGRFLQPDPIGYAGGANLYAYADNDPLNLTDPSGNCPWCIAVGAVIGAAVGGTHAYLEGGNFYAVAAGAVIGAGTGVVVATTAPIALANLVLGSAAATASGTTIAATTFGTTVAIGATGGAAVDAAAQAANIASGNQSQFRVRQFAVGTAEGALGAAGGSALIKAGEALAIASGAEVGTAVGVTGEAAAGQIEGAATGIGAITHYALEKAK